VNYVESELQKIDVIERDLDIHEITMSEGYKKVIENIQTK